MRVVVYPHDLEIGGSQINAIELAARTRDLGHEVLVYGRPGALVGKVVELGLEFVEAPRPLRRPSPAVVRHLRSLVLRRGIDVVHGYEWPPALEAYLATGWGTRARPVCTVMSMAVAPFLPRGLPLIVGTEQIADVERRHGRSPVHTIEPPVDLAANAPDQTRGAAELRERLVTPGHLAVVCVTRLAHELKLEGVLAAVEAVGALARDHPVQLLLVGDGPARPEVEAAAKSINQTLDRAVVRLLGQLDDPRPAYALGDVQIAMGGSALRSLAFGKPLVVQGERGFFEVATPETVHQFEWTGWYGVGTSTIGGAALLTEKLRPLITDPGRRAELGAFSRRYVAGRFGLDAAAERQIEIYEHVLASADRKARAVPLARAVGEFARYVGARQWARLGSRSATDDFNSRPVAASGHERRRG